jgi:hypothetical protein
LQADAQPRPASGLVSGAAELLAIDETPHRHEVVAPARDRGLPAGPCRGPERGWPGSVVGEAESGCESERCWSASGGGQPVAGETGRSKRRSQVPGRDSPTRQCQPTTLRFGHVATVLADQGGVVEVVMGAKLGVPAGALGPGDGAHELVLVPLRFGDVWQSHRCRHFVKKSTRRRDRSFSPTLFAPVDNITHFLNQRRPASLDAWIWSANTNSARLQPCKPSNPLSAQAPTLTRAPACPFNRYACTSGRCCSAD